VQYAFVVVVEIFENLGCCSQGSIDKNSNFQKKLKTCFLTFMKTLKTWIKTLNCSILSSKKHCKYESNKVNNTATKHSLCPGNGVCLTLTRPQATQFSTFMF